MASVALDSNAPIEKSVLHDWAEGETRALDVVASWESLCDTYRALEFTDPIGDTVRMEEFKWIIAEMNKHLSRARKKLLTCRDPLSMQEALMDMFTPTGKVNISDRKSLAYHKLRQRWVMQMLVNLEELASRMNEKEESENGRADFWNE